MKLDLKREHQTYRLADGTKVVGVTTALGVLAKQPLLGWYADVEREGVLDCIKRGVPLPEGRFAEQRRDKAADVGTVIHAHIEGWLTGDALVPDGIPDAVWDQSLDGFERFKEWWTLQRLTLVASEVQMVVPGPYPYGGTADIVALDDKGVRVLVDIKSTKASRYWPYDETFAQVAAYADAYHVSVGDPIERIAIVRVGKERKDKVQAYWLDDDERSSGYRLFSAALEVYYAKKALDKARKGADR